MDSWIRDKGVSGSIQLQDREQGSRLFEEAKYFAQSASVAVFQ
jgi:hypothetical protein